MVIFNFLFFFESVANPIMLETVFQPSLENLVYFEHSTNLSDNEVTNIKVNQLLDINSKQSKVRLIIVSTYSHVEYFIIVE